MHGCERNALLKLFDSHSLSLRVERVGMNYPGLTNLQSRIDEAKLHFPEEFRQNHNSLVHLLKTIRERIRYRKKFLDENGKAIRTPEMNAENSVRVTKLFEERPEYREKVSVRTKEAMDRIPCERKVEWANRANQTKSSQGTQKEVGRELKARYKTNPGLREVAAKKQRDYMENNQDKVFGAAAKRLGTIKENPEIMKATWDKTRERMNDPKNKKLMSRKLKDTFAKPEVKERHRESIRQSWQKPGHREKMIDLAVARIQRDGIYSSKDNGYEQGVWCDSGWEKAFVRWYYSEHGIKNIIRWRHKGIPYLKFDGQVHKYVPDFVLDRRRIIFEVKGAMNHEDVLKWAAAIRNGYSVVVLRGAFVKKAKTTPSQTGLQQVLDLISNQEQNCIYLGRTLYSHNEILSLSKDPARPKRAFNKGKERCRILRLTKKSGTTSILERE